MPYFSLSIILSSSLLILVVAALRWLLRGKISPRLSYALWLLVALRLLLPVEIGSLDFSVSAISDSASVQQRTEQIALPLRPYQPVTAEQYAAETGLPAIDISDEQLEVYARQQQQVTLAQILFQVWLAGAIIMALWQLWVNLRFAYRLRRCARPQPVAEDAAAPLACTLPVYRAGHLSSPCLFGLLRPAIYLDQPLDSRRLRHILVHELCHWRHGDQWWALLRALCLCLHWYNPLVWLAASLSRRDAELACDQAALALLGEAERLPYGETLISLLRQERKKGEQDE